MTKRREQHENQLSNRECHVLSPLHQLKWSKKADRSGATVLRGRESSTPFFSTAEFDVTFLI